MPDFSPQSESKPDVVRVLLADDSLPALQMAARLLATSSSIEVVGMARNGREALNLLAQTRPSVICTADVMTVMDGLELTRRVMAVQACPILVMYEGLLDTARRAALITAGVVDTRPKPRLDLVPGSRAFEEAARELIALLRRLSGVVVLSRRASASPFLDSSAPTTSAPASSLVAASPLSPLPGSPRPVGVAGTVVPRPGTGGTLRLVAVGASTGGPHALAALFEPLPADFSLPIVCVQHISAGFLTGLIEWLDARCAVRVTVARPGENPQPGHVYFAPEDAHLVLDAGGRLQYSPTDPVDGHRPSATALLRSAAERYGADAAGVLLTGMGDDGAQGLLAIAQAGGITFAQDEASCVVYGMPAQAVKLGAARYILPPAMIAQELIRRARRFPPLRP